MKDSYTRVSLVRICRLFGYSLSVLLLLATGSHYHERKPGTFKSTVYLGRAPGDGWQKAL